MLARITCFVALVAQTLAFAEPPLVTTAAQLAPRQDNNPELVGYFSRNGGFTDPRFCNGGETVSTSGSYVQCCAATGTCAFYTACSANTLILGTTSVPCDFDAASTCNTAIVARTVGAANGGSFLGCWQKTLGSAPFTLVQDIGSGSVIQPSTTSASASSTTRPSSITSTGTGPARTSATSSTTTTSSPNVAPTGDSAGVNGAILGGLALAAQLLI